MVTLSPGEQTCKGPCGGIIGAPPAGEVQLHPPCIPSSQLNLPSGFCLVTVRVTVMALGGAGCLASLRAGDPLHLLLGKRAATADFSRCERSLSCESLQRRAWKHEQN